MRTEELRKGSQGRAGNQVSEEESALMRLVPRALEKLQSVITCGCHDGGLFLGRCWRGQRNVEGASLSPSWGFPLALLWVEANGIPPDQPGKGGVWLQVPSPSITKHSTEAER